MKNFLCAHCTRDEVDRTLSQMHLHKAPDPDGMSPFFFQKFWDTIADDVATVVISILNGHAIPP